MPTKRAARRYGDLEKANRYMRRVFGKKWSFLRCPGCQNIRAIGKSAPCHVCGCPFHEYIAVGRWQTDITESARQWRHKSNNRETIREKCTRRSER